MTVHEIAALLAGELEGDGSVEITGLAGLEEAEPGDISFLANPRYAARVSETRASAVVVGCDWQGDCRAAVIRVADADEAFSQLAARMAPVLHEPPPGIHPSAVVAPDATLGPGVSIGPQCVIERGASIGCNTVVMAGCYIGQDTAVGEQCRLYPHVSVRERCTIGNRVILHNGVVIGSDGFGYVRDADGWRKIPQIGTVALGDDVEIGANTTVDRARFGKTVLANGVKIDNLVQIAHNVSIGERTAVAAQSGISGSTALGCDVRVGGQTGMDGHLQVGDGAVCGARSGVTKDVPAGTFVSGYPAMAHNKARKIHAHLMRLPELKKKIAELEQRLAELENGSAAT